MFAACIAGIRVAYIHAHITMVQAISASTGIRNWVVSVMAPPGSVSWSAEPSSPGRGAQRRPPQVRWKADNYNHLHEQPTIFYALMFFAALTGGADATATAMAWAYVGLRVVHSMVQATVNRIVVRFSIFMLASLVLVAFTVREAMRLM